MRVETIEISGLASTLNALRLPFGKDVRSDIETDIRSRKNSETGEDELITYTGITIDPKDLALMMALVARGDEHAKAVRGMIAYAKITAPIYWWCELETYRAGHERLASESTMHIDCKGITGDDLVTAKSSIPMGHELTKVDLFSYQCLRNIVRQRKDHRLPEWHQFIDWVKTLPYAKELIFYGIE